MRNQEKLRLTIQKTKKNYENTTKNNNKKVQKFKRNIKRKDIREI